MPEDEEPFEPDHDGLWYIDYTCPHCHQEGTARFKRKDMVIGEDDYLIPKKEIYCCQCRRKGVEIEEVQEC